MKISKDKRDKLILTCLAFMGVAGVLYTFVLGAQQETLARLQKQLLLGRDKLAKAERLVKSRATIEGDLKSSQEVLDKRLEQMAPQGQYYYWFIKLMDRFREQENLASSFIIDVTQPEFIEAGLAPNFPYKAASFGLRLSGGYQEIGRFISDLENAYPYFRVQNVRMSPQGTAFPGTIDTKQPALAQSSDAKLIVELRIVTLFRGGNT